MKFKILAFLIFIFYASYSISSNNINSKFRIQASAPSEKGSTVYLARYWKSNPYVIDSTTVSSNGKFYFSKHEPLESGQYLILIKPDKKIELLIDQQQENIKIDFDRELLNSTIKGSDDTQLYWEYIKEYSKYVSEIERLYNIIQAKDSSKTDQEKAKKDYITLINKIEAIQNNYIKKNKGTWFATFIKANKEVKPPHLFPETTEQKIENGKYLRTHFFDNIDLEDKRLWNTEFFSNQLDYFFKNIVSQHPDSIAQATSEVVNKTRNNEGAFTEMLSDRYNAAVTSQIMGMENVWAKLAEDYIIDEKISWIDSTLYSNILAEYSLIEQNRMGMTAQDLLLKTIKGNPIHTSEIEGKYTLLYFYSTTCSHCDREIKELKESFFPKYKDKGLTVIAVNTGTDIEEWNKFMDKHEMESNESWYNLFDPDFSSQYWLKFDVSATPSLYFLDNEKQILAKKINLSSLDQYLNNILK